MPFSGKTNGLLQERIHGTKNQGIELVHTIELFQGLQAFKARVENVSALNNATDQQENVIIFRNAINGYRFSLEQERMLTSSSLGPKGSFYRAINVSRNNEVMTYCLQKTKEKE